LLLPYDKQKYLPLLRLGIPSKLVRLLLVVSLTSLLLAGMHLLRAALSPAVKLALLCESRSRSNPYLKPVTLLPLRNHAL